MIEKYRKYRLKKLKQKMKKLGKEQEFYKSYKRFLTAYEYEKVTDIIAGDMVRVKKKIARLEHKTLKK